MLSVSLTSKRIIAALFVLSAAVTVVGVVLCLFLGHTAAVAPFITGVAVGAVFAALKMILIERAISRSMSMQPQMSTNYVRLHFILRYTLTGAILAVAALNPRLSLLGVALGLFSMQPAAYAVSFIFKEPLMKPGRPRRQRRNDGVSELSRLRGGERYNVSDDEEVRL